MLSWRLRAASTIPFIRCSQFTLVHSKNYSKLKISCFEMFWVELFQHCSHWSPRPSCAACQQAETTFPSSQWWSDQRESLMLADGKSRQFQAPCRTDTTCLKLIWNVLSVVNFRKVWLKCHAKSESSRGSWRELKSKLGMASWTTSRSNQRSKAGSGGQGGQVISARDMTCQIWHVTECITDWSSQSASVCGFSVLRSDMFHQGSQRSGQFDPDCLSW